MPKIGTPQAAGLAALAISPFAVGLPGSEFHKGLEAITAELGPPATPVSDALFDTLEPTGDLLTLRDRVKKYSSRLAMFAVPAVMEAATIGSYFHAYQLRETPLHASVYVGAAVGVRFAMYVGGRRLQRMFGSTKEDDPPLFC